MKFHLAASIIGLESTYVAAQNQHKQQHYLVGLLNYPNTFIPDELKNHTSGTAIPKGDAMWSESDKAPFSYVPGVGFSDMEFYYDDEGNKVTGEYFCLTDNGFGSSDNSADYALNIQHLKIQKPFTFRHAETTFEKYTEAQNIGVALLQDPDGLIKWENGADIQVAYAVPDETWADYKAARVLTGRDFDVEGLAVINNKCAVAGDELMPAIFMVNPTTGVVLSKFVRTPDIDSKGYFNGKYLSTRSDKVHCSIADLEANACSSVASEVVDASEYRKHDKSGGYEGFSILDDGTIVAFLEKNSGDTTFSDEPGVRVYHVKPGDCTSGSAPTFEKFMGFYPFEIGAGNIADVSAIPGSSRFVAVIERNGFPNGHMWPGAGNPANNLCIVDLLDVDENMVMKNKKCILNYHDIDDPWDVDGNGIFKYGHTQVTNEALVIVDDIVSHTSYCRLRIFSVARKHSHDLLSGLVAGTDTNYPWTNQFGIDVSSQYYQEVDDARFMVVCFVEPIFNSEHPLLKSFGAKPSEMPAAEVDGTATAIDRGADDSSRALMAYDYTTHGTLAFVGGLLLALGGFVLAA